MSYSLVPHALLQDQTILVLVNGAKGGSPERSPNVDLARSGSVTERVSGLTIGEELNPPTALTNERVKMEHALSKFRPVSEEKVSRTARATSPEGDVSHIGHLYVAGRTLRGKTCLSCRF